MNMAKPFLYLDNSLIIEMIRLSIGFIEYKLCHRHIQSYYIENVSWYELTVQPIVI